MPPTEGDSHANSPVAPRSCHFQFQSAEKLTDFATDLSDLLSKVKEGTEALGSTPAARARPGSEVLQALQTEDLGPMNGRCPTCRLFVNSRVHADARVGECSGHFAHMKLPCPVYHPLLFDVLLKILKSSCVACHRLCADPVIASSYARQLAIARAGFVEKASEVTPLIDYLTNAKFNPCSTESSQDPPKKKTKKSVSINTDAMEEDGDNDPLSKLLNSASVGHKIDEILSSAVVTQGEADSNTMLLVQRREMEAAAVAYLLKPNGEKQKVYCHHCGEAPLNYKVSKLRIFHHLPIDGRKKEWRPWSIKEVRDHLETLWINDADKLQVFAPHLGSEPRGWEALFVTHLPIVPPRFRKTVLMEGSGAGGMYHSHTKSLQSLHHLQIEYERPVRAGDKPKDTTKVENDIQYMVTSIFDSSKLPASAQKDVVGVRQIIEKKEGLFRNNLMSARVNFACRSVISPDPSLEPNEVLLPIRFARELTYPERVTTYNAAALATMVRNGPKKYPGAVRIITDAGKPTEQLRELRFTSNDEREHIASELEVGALAYSTVVQRHILDGDWALFNRQPSLHRGSMLAHKVKVLTEGRTFRFHYANCKGYNADFDGDEMNIHIPQTLAAQAEAKYLADADQHYIIPTAGKPVRGLIQDVVSMGVLLTRRDCFLPYDTYVDHVYHALHTYLDDQETTIPISDFLLPPAILRPRPLWSGKQVVSSILRYLCNPPIDFEGASLVTDDVWKSTRANTHPVNPFYQADEDLKEGRVVVRRSQLLIGVMDTKQVGASAFSLVHAVHQLYGAPVASRLLAAISRLMGRVLKSFAFTCGIADLCLRPDAEIQRTDLLALGNRCPEDIPTEQKIIAALGKASTEVNQLFPSGMQRPFPFNMLAMMTMTGAKGSKNNAYQMALHLGQQSFGGARVHNLVTGRSLPCFTKDDRRGCAKAWVRGRYLTGISPSDYYIHSIAGRDGLIDTAIKTASSGYLQRCLIKGLEGLVAQYDKTVRDSDRMVVQFHYGEDGLDTTRAEYLTKFDLFAKNPELLAKRYEGCRDLKAAASGLPAMAEKYTKALDEFLLAPGKGKGNHGGVDPQWLKSALHLQYAQAYVEAGEPVGLIAAQSIGEPSTQMTLNTFHHAGSSAAHVTEGIPRLRQLLMAGSVKNPVIRIPIASPAHHQRVRQLIRQRILDYTLANLLDPEDGLECDSPYAFGPSMRSYAVTLKFNPALVAQYDAQSYMPGAVKSLLKKIRQQVTAFQTNSICRVSKASSLALSSAGAGKDSASPTDPSETLKPDEAPDEEAGGDYTAAPNEEDDAADGSEAASQAPEAEDEASGDDEDDDSADASEKAEDSEGDAGSLDGKSVRSEAPSDVESESEETDAVVESPKRKVPTAKKPAAKKARAAPRKKLYLDPEWLDSHTFRVEIQMPDNARCIVPNIMREVLAAIHPRKPTNVLNASIIHDPKSKNGEGQLLQIAGGQLSQLMGKLMEEADSFDFTRLYCSDIHAMNKMFGVEAGYKVFMGDIQGVFASHNVSVDPRHISLIADYALLGGEWRAFNRLKGGAVAQGPGVLHQMSFETSTQFLVRGAVEGVVEPLTNPSARIMLGLAPEMGAGAPFEVTIDPKREAARL